MERESGREWRGRAGVGKRGRGGLRGSGEGELGEGISVGSVTEDIKQTRRCERKQTKIQVNLITGTKLWNHNHLCSLSLDGVVIYSLCIGWLSGSGYICH